MFPNHHEHYKGGSASVDLSSVTESYTTFLDNEGNTVVDRFKKNDPATEIDRKLIYGRDKELQLLLQAYDRVADTKKRETVTVHGLSGLGKTALVENFRDKVCHKGGLFCSGKYLQNMGVQEPFYAIMAAFSDLCDLVLQSESYNEQRKEQIKRDIGRSEVQLRRVISNLSPFLGDISHEDTRSYDVKTDGAGSLFKIACKAFLRAMATAAEEPIVVFLDDIQWMDIGSVHLLEMYLNDSDLENVMFVLAYRDDEEHVVSASLSKVNVSDFVDVHVKSLGLDDVAKMVSAVFRDSIKDDGKLQDLKDLVYQRTHGNPFHVLQFLDVIQNEGLLIFDHDTKLWVFDVNRIRGEVMVSETVASLLLRKVLLLPVMEQEILKIASLLGYHFDEHILSEALRLRNRDETNRDEAHGVSGGFSWLSEINLSKSLKWGLVEKTGELVYFPHDRIQEAFHAMLTEGEELELHGLIGEAYLSVGGDDRMYGAAVHFNQAHQIHHDVKDRLKLARINLEAAHYVTDRFSFEIAARLLRKGLSILGGVEERWSIDFELAFEMTEQLAKMELSIGNLDSCKELIQETLRRATSLDMKLGSFIIAVECYIGGNEPKTTLATAFDILQMLGIRMPRQTTMLHVMLTFFRVRRLLRGRTDEDILTLPPMQDRKMAAATHILVNLYMNCVNQNEPTIGLHSALLACELTLKHGLTPLSACAVLVYSIVEVSFSNQDRALRFGKLGLSLANREENKINQCYAIALYTTFLMHRVARLHDLRDPLVSATESGFEIGDVVCTPVVISNLFGIRLFDSDNLVDIEHFMRQMYSRLCDLSNDAMLMWAQPPFQAVLNMVQSDTTDWMELTVLTGEVMNEDEFLRKATAANNPLMVVILLTFKTRLLYQFGFISLAEELYRKLVVPDGFDLNWAGMTLHLFGSLVFYERYKQTHKRGHLKKARQYQRFIDRAHSQGIPFAKSSFILHAEALANRGRSKTTVSIVTAMYDHAIAEMKSQDSIQLEALANERAGFFLAGCKGYEAQAKRYFERALELYRCGWGAVAKADWLEEQCARCGYHLFAAEDEVLAVDHVACNILMIPKVVE